MNIIIRDILAVVGAETVRSDIYIGNGTILSLNERPMGFVPDKVISGADRLAIPALINCHTHAYMSLFRNIADDLPFNEWLFDRIMPLEDIIDGEDAYWGCMLSCAEMIKSGTGTFCDMHMFPNATTEAVKKSGMRAVVSRGLSGGKNDAAGGARRINEAKAELERYSSEPLISFMLAPHAVFTCDRDYIKEIMRLAERLSLPLNIHISESAAEVKSSLSEYGQTPVEYLDSIGFFAHKTLAAHCVHLTEKDMDILSQRNVSVAANPKSNLKLGNGIAPIKALHDRGINICIGTDSAASNNSLNMFSEMNFTALLHKGTSGDASAISSSEVLSMATENGAEALGIDCLGKIEVGYKADIALISTSNPQMQPMNNPISALSYSATGGEVDTMITGGEVVMENRRLTTLDEEEIYHNIKRITKKLGGNK
ncbi:MAG: cytosine deaminase [Firmicutes bacterium HGW-Firmicutes-21]|nr:MAG: cytosine deaminase [Firmicutes bacterium HGW-Firmicutes-21]